MLTPLNPIPPRTSRLINPTPFFYGWIIVIAGAFGLIMTGPGQTYAVSIFIEHFIHDLGFSRTLVSGLYGVGTLVGSFALPLIGREIDRRGSRPMGVAIALLFGLAFIFMGLVVNWPMLLLAGCRRSQNGTQINAENADFGAKSSKNRRRSAKSASENSFSDRLLGFMTIGMLGQCGLEMVSQNVINQWWVSRRGMIMGVSGLGFPYWASAFCRG